MATRKQLVDRWKHEPGASVQRAIDAWVVAQAARRWQGADSAELFALLDGLIYRDEVPGGRDLRGSTWNGAIGCDLRGCDLSHCRELGGFIACDLTGARLDQARIDGDLRGRFVEVSLRKATLRNLYMGRAVFERCDFTGAVLRGANLRESDVRGCCFRDANLEGTDLQKADLRGCDLRGARLKLALFEDVVLDASTDLRGADLVGLCNEDRHDFAGNLISRATDWRVARWDDTTRHGAAPGAEDRRMLNAIIRAARQERTPWATLLAEEARRLVRRLDDLDELRWLEPLIAAVAPADQEAARELVQRATLELG